MSKYDYALLPCPFCGGKPHLERSTRVYFQGKTVHAALVHCTVCGARTGKVPLENYGCTSSSTEANDEAVRLWNSRTPNFTVEFKEKEREE